MLKALELVGFKSFADKTRFEFPPGITVIVGPNGSGKSNVVDAIKWVLGEQSVKSLRGQEMADVIFNGSGSRRALNAAEITLTLDNSDRLLAVDTPEVHITRRVYRGGEGEYLINRQPSRLRDIRDLISGTGLGAQAYSVIEQGKVDVLLQASPRDRRVIFEEAAGISRFKARKIEALRRLERVEQNLLRLSDIVDEVENRLRSVRMQAGKARRYKQYADRLQELRTQTALVDWRRLTEKLDASHADLAALEAQRDNTRAEAEAAEARLLEAETRIAAVNEAMRQTDAKAAGYRERIAAAESTIDHQRARSRDLEQEIGRYRRQLAAMNSRAGGLDHQLRETAEAIRQAEDHQRQIARGAGESERCLTDLMARLDQVRSEGQQLRAAHFDQMRAAAALGNQISALESQAAAAESTCQRTERRLAELKAQLAALAEESDALRRRHDELAAQLEAQTQRLAAARARLAQCGRERELHQTGLAELQRRHAAVAERVSVLDELEKRYEGLSPGVKDVLTLARSAQGGPWRRVRGLVADLLRVSVEAAPLVEVALGETAQHVVVAPGDELLEYLQSGPCPMTGRVGFVWLPDRAEQPAAGDADLGGQPGVLGRADRFVQTEPEYEPLARRLLGRTWVVERLSHALAVAQAAGPGWSFVTLAGELLSADGTLVVGPRHASIGLISRRSELRALRAQLAGLESEVQQAQTAILRLDQQIAQEGKHVAGVEAECEQAAQALGEHAHKITAAQERGVQMAQQRSVLEAELRVAAAERDSARSALSEARLKREQCEGVVTEMESRLAAASRQTDRLEADRRLLGRQATEEKVELAKSEERLRNLRARMRQFEETRQERQRAIAECGEELAKTLSRAEQSRWSILRAESEIAELYLGKETFAAETVELIQQREAIQEDRLLQGSEVQKLRAKLRKIEEKVHARQLAANEVGMERAALEARFREDYQVELSELEHSPSDEDKRQREEVQREIDDLRQKINNLGNVNLEAIEELEQAEARHAGLSGQYKDLNDAKNSLVRIIERINADSRRLFADTLQTVREHFGNLFRDLFGGGQADIVLEEGVDILESGVEIVARPPGKEPRSISLLSGGEKTLTCAALLLAIFRSRPSPFCVLDEVDAALDEANIDRFIKVLKDFLTWTQFIIVTHSKKTMTCANTIYGVTMQDSGVSKQVSVRFEDVSENGEIRVAARTEEPPESAGPAEPQDERRAA
jgi:chromosome segregation protein